MLCKDAMQNTIGHNMNCMNCIKGRKDSTDEKLKVKRTLSNLYSSISPCRLFLSYPAIL